MGRADVVAGIASLFLAIAAPPGATVEAAPADNSLLALAGDWAGLLPGREPTRVVVHIRPAGDAVAATYDNLDRGVRDAPLADVRRDGPTVSFALPGGRMRYEARLDAAARTLSGWVSQDAGPSIPLDLSRED